MKKIILVSLIFIGGMFAENIYAQSLPSGTCGIVYTYDAAGNRTKREFVLNNTAAALQAMVIDSQKVAVKDLLKVYVLCPNPTTGRFTVHLAKPLSNATVIISDIVGRLVLRRNENGNVLTYDLSGQPIGVYLLNIVQGQQTISMKILKK